MSDQSTTPIPPFRLRYFIAAWLFPVLMVGIAIVEEQRGGLPRYLGWLISPLFIASYAILLFRRKVTRRDATVYGIVVPFLIALVAITVKLIFFPHEKAA